MIRNERGSVTFYAIWMLIVTFFLMFLIVNVIGIYAAKEQASISAEQAALAATDVVYDTVDEVIDDYRGPILENIDNDDLEGQPELGGESLREEIEEKKDDLLNQGLYGGQAKMEAIDIVLSSKLQDKKYGNLKSDIQEALFNIRDDIENIANRVVSSNNGDSAETAIHFFNDENRIEVKTNSSFKAVQYEKIFRGVSDDIPQKSAGPKIEFISNIEWVNISL